MYKFAQKTQIANQAGFSLLLLLAGLTLLLFLLITSMAPFRHKLMSTIFPKGFSFAAGNITIDANSNVHPISPYIYGTAANTDPYQKTMGATVSRWGGNQISRSNWENNDSNAGSDWGPYCNVWQASGASQTAGKALVDSVKGARTQGMDFLYSVSTIGWVSKDGNNSTCSTGVPGNDGPPINSNGAITGYDPTANRNKTGYPAKINKGSSFIYPPNTTDNIVYQDEGISYLKSQVDSVGGVKFYSFDNEYDIWSSTHRDIHPSREGYDSLLAKYIEFGDMVKRMDPNALTTGPVSWGWTNYWFSPLDQGNDGYATLADRKAHGNVPLLQWFLRQLKAHDTTVGKRTLDVLDVHFYPQAGQYSNDVSTSMQALRLRSTRDLWDPTYTTESWMTCCEGGPQIQVIRRLKSWVNAEYPGTKVGITEWNWGADNHINGALAIADVLGIFGREDVYLANYWTTPADQSPGYWAWRMYRNYDGAFSRFGDISVNATVPTLDIDKVSVYASKDSGNNSLKLMVINKQPSATYDLSLSLANFSPGGAAKVYRYAQSDTSKINQVADVPLSGTTLAATVPAYSITLFVIPASGTGPSPSPSVSPSLAPSPSPSKTPSPSPSPQISPTPQISPSPSSKPGDIDGNNKVDIFDYNILLTNFGKTGTAIQGDLDGNNKVDIFDYNILLTNFGH